MTHAAQPAAVADVRVVVRAPTWRGEPTELTYVFLAEDAGGDTVEATCRWARAEGLANPRVVPPFLLRWSELFNPRFHHAAAEPSDERMVFLDPEAPGDTTRHWAESVLFLAGVTLSAAIVQSRFSSGTLASKYDRLWQIGRVAQLGALPELAPLDLPGQVERLVADTALPDVERLLAIRRLFHDAWRLLPGAARYETTAMVRAPLAPEIEARFDFVGDLVELAGGDLDAVIAYGSALTSDDFADYDLLLVTTQPELLLGRLAGRSPAWHGKELNVGVYSPQGLWDMQRLSGDNLAGYGAVVHGEAVVPTKPAPELLARNLSFGMVRLRQQLGMVPVALEPPAPGAVDDRRNLYEYFVKIPANVVKGTLGVVGTTPSKEDVHRWLARRVGFDAVAQQRRSTSGEPASALAHAAVATAGALDALNDDLGIVRWTA